MRIERIRAAAQARGRGPGPMRAAFTLIEMMLVITIASIIALIAIDFISSFEAHQRAERAARESLSCFRAARNLAMTTGKYAKVVVDTTGQTLTILWNQAGDSTNGTNGTFVTATNGMTSSGNWVLNVNSARDLVGTTVSLNPATTSSFIYSALGTCAQTGTLTFTYASQTKSLVVYNVGDPQLQ